MGPSAWFSANPLGSVFNAFAVPDLNRKLLDHKIKRKFRLSSSKSHIWPAFRAIITSKIQSRSPASRALKFYFSDSACSASSPFAIRMELLTMEVLLLLFLSPYMAHPRPMFSVVRGGASSTRTISGAEKAAGVSTMVPWAKAASNPGPSSNSFFGSLGKKLPLKKNDNWHPGNPNDIEFSVPASYRRNQGDLRPLSRIPEHSATETTATQFKEAFPTRTEKFQATKKRLAQLSTTEPSPTSSSLLQRFQRFFKTPQQPTGLTRSSQAVSLQRFEQAEKKMLGLIHPQLMKNMMKNAKGLLEQFRVSLTQLTTRFAKRLEQVAKTVNEKTSQQWRQLSQFLFPKAQAAKNS